MLLFFLFISGECENSSVQKRLVEVRGTLNNPSEIENNQGFISTTGKESSSKSTVFFIEIYQGNYNLQTF